MLRSQVILLVCEDMDFSQTLKDYLDLNLNIYSYSIIPVKALAKTIMEEGLARDKVFDQMTEIFNSQSTQRVIVFGHAPCASNLETDKSQHEIFLRHIVSILRARFPDKDTTAYITDTSNTSNAIEQIA